MRPLRGRRAPVPTALLAAAAIALTGCGEGDDETAATTVPGPAMQPAELGPCPEEVRIRNLRCGTVEVPKFRSAPELGSFDIGFAVRPQRDRDAPSEGAIFAVEGGPGYSTTGTANSYDRLFGDLLDRRDLVLVDMRGTGTSDPIRCPDVQRGLAPDWIAMAECARRLGTDFEAYATGPAAEDIDAVRAALGLDEITLYGDSYGTFLAQSYAFRHPDRLIALVLDGAYPVRGESPWYPSLLRSGIRNLDVACDRAPACPPGAGDRLTAAVELMRDRGLRAGAMVDAIIGAAYSPPGSYLRVDRAVRAMPERDFAPWRRLTLAETVAYRNASRYSHAQELAVSCNDYPMIWDKDASEPERRAQLERAIRRYEDDAFAPFTPREVAIGSESGYLDCLTWPAPTELREPPVPPGAEPTEAPVLVVNGELDDITTPREGGLVAEQFPDARRFVGRNDGHVDALYDPAGPSARVIRRFLRGAYAGDLKR